jgi:hypothetical protein
VCSARCSATALEEVTFGAERRLDGDELMPGPCDVTAARGVFELELSKSGAVLRRSGDGRILRRMRGGVMPEYMLLLYAPEVDEAERQQEDRWADMPLWLEVTESLRKAGLLVANGPLHSVATATTVRVRDGDTEVTDGPFAVTKEVLAGYYVLNCADLDEALHHAARMPTARDGSVEVRPLMGMSEIPAPGQAPASPT